MRGGCFRGCKTLDPPTIRLPVRVHEAYFGDFCRKMYIFPDDHESGTYLFIGRWIQKNRNRNLTDLGGSKL